jgi:anti-sigma-K factor RskA
MNPDERERVAAEHVMGLLEGEERQRAERLLGSDPAFQASVDAWQARMSELDEAASPVAAGDDLWRRIEGSLVAASAEGASADQSQTHAPAMAVVVPDPRNAFRSLWHNLAFWRVAGLAGALATFALAVGLAVLAQRSASAPVLVAVLLTEANQPAGVINAYRNGEAELVPFAGMQIPQGRAFEIWAIPGPGQTPISIGLLTQPRSAKLNLERVPSLRPDQTFAISVEPPQGSPTGLPTGPVLMKGTTTTAL